MRNNALGENHVIWSGIDNVEFSSLTSRDCMNWWTLLTTKDVSGLVVLIYAHSSLHCGRIHLTPQRMQLVLLKRNGSWNWFGRLLFGTIQEIHQCICVDRQAWRSSRSLYSKGVKNEAGQDPSTQKRMSSNYTVNVLRGWYSENHVIIIN